MYHTHILQSVTQNQIRKPLLPAQGGPTPRADHLLMFDGGSRGNPGLCGAGYVLTKQKDILYEGSDIVATNNTNNYAEYMALFLGLSKARELGITSLNVKGDSQLVINQVTGVYAVKSSNLEAIYKATTELMGLFESVEFEHVKRGLNKHADALANKAMDTYQADRTQCHNKVS
jgi:ribonuclease HI